MELVLRQRLGDIFFGKSENESPECGSDYFGGCFRDLGPFWLRHGEVSYEGMGV